MELERQRESSRERRGGNGFWVEMVSCFCCCHAGLACCVTNVAAGCKALDRNSLEYKHLINFSPRRTNKIIIPICSGATSYTHRHTHTCTGIHVTLTNMHCHRHTHTRIEVNVHRGGRKLAVLRLHHGANPTECY